MGDNQPISNDGNYYDKMSGISQGIINSSFRDLFQDVEGVSKMYYRHAGFGTLDATMHAPTVLIDGFSEQPFNILYRLRIKSGEVIFPNGYSVILDDWVLVVDTPLKEMILDILPEDSPDLQARKKKMMAHTEHASQYFPTKDYQVQRISAALGTARWSSPDQRYSTCCDANTKQTIPLHVWAAQHKDGRYQADVLNLLQRWAEDKEDERISTLSLYFTPRQEKPTGVNPTIRPVHRVTQVQRYVGVDGTGRYTGAGSYESRDQTHPHGRFENGDYNCLVCCENFDATSREKRTAGIPENSVVSHHNGSLARPAMNGLSPLYGSIIIDRRFFLQTFYLPQLQEMCKAIFIEPGQSKLSIIPGGAALTLNPTYAVGTELEGKPPRLSSDPLFNFKVTPRGNFIWHVRWYDSGSIGINSWQHVGSECSIAIHWSPNSNVLMFAFQWTWTLHVRWNECKGEMLGPEILSLDNQGLPLDWSIRKAGDPSYLGSTIGVKVEHDIESKLRHSFKKGIAAVIENTKGGLGISGNGVYPGYGHLKYTNPTFTEEEKNIVLKAEYETPSSPGGTTPLPGIPSTPFIQFSDTLALTQDPVLMWTIEFDYNKDLKLGNLILRASNQTAAPVAFVSIAVTLIPTTEGTNAGHKLFTGNEWNEESESVMQANFKRKDTTTTTKRNAFRFDQTVTTSPGGIMFDVSAKMSSVEAAITPKAREQNINIHQKKGFAIELQGTVPALGQYAVKIQESWKYPRGTASQRGPLAVNYLIVELGLNADGKVEWNTWDEGVRRKRR
ncbi:hypothetical protein EDB80DRAFT_809550 [Ilyonectria destructans]|nr:hypothetical protein EDB80DRAFT_809550 [Ilyonectria destructans]